MKVSQTENLSGKGPALYIRR